MKVSKFGFFTNGVYIGTLFTYFIWIYSVRPEISFSIFIPILIIIIGLIGSSVFNREKQNDTP